MVPCAERVRLTNSGTESTLLAIRLGRAFTGKPKMLRFTGHFHGWHDHVSFGVSSHFDGTPTPGVLPEIADNVVFAPPWDFETTKDIVLANDDIGTAIIEPTGSTWGQVPISREFLDALRALCAERGITLIFDEVISGFRASPGGIQEAWGIVPDMATLGKIVAGGMHGAAVVGRAEILDLMDFRIAARDGVEKVFHQGTYNAMPASCAAGIATLDIIRTTDACNSAVQYGRSLQGALNRVFEEENVPWVSYGTFGIPPFLNPNRLSLTPSQIESGRSTTRLYELRPNQLAAKIRVGMLLHSCGYPALAGSSCVGGSHG